MCGRRETRGGSDVLVVVLALVFWPLTTHPFPDGAPFLLLLETPQTFGHSVRFFHTLHITFSLISSASYLAVCGRHLSPRIAIVFSLLSNVPNFSTSHLSTLPTSSSNTFHPCTVHFLPLCGCYFRLCCHKSSSTRLKVYFFLLSGRSRSTTRKRSFGVFA